MKPGDSPFTPARVANLDYAWARYSSVRRSIYVGAPHALRRYLRSQDEAALTVDMTRYSSAASSGMRGWIAACRKILGRHVSVEPLGPAVLGMPSAFLVRVPRHRSAVLDERVWGRPGADPVVRERLDAMRRLHAHERELAARDKRQKRLYATMIEALTEARVRLVEKAAARERAKAITDRGITSTKSREYVTDLRQVSYEKHARAARCMERAHRYRRLLEAEGFMYDLNSIDTPLQLGEGS